MDVKEKMKSFLHKSFATEQVFLQNEIHANSLVALAMLLNTALILITWLLNYVGVFEEAASRMNNVVLRSLPELLIPAALCFCFKGNKPWLKYLLMLEFTVVLARLDSMLGYNAPLMMVIPVVLSVRYFSRRFTSMISLLTAVLFGVSAFCGAYFNMAPLDLNFYFPAPGTVLQVEKYLDVAVLQSGVDSWSRAMNYMVLGFLPKLLLFSLIAIVCSRIARRGHDMVLEHEATVQDAARIDTELSLAASIQSSMLPCDFPPFPQHEEFQIYASMDPAKEVGGDFYDFFMPDEKTLAIVVADVSGKGVPAALFMAISKTLIRDQTAPGITPAEVFTKVNRMLCEGNDAALFVTAWMGILDLETGMITYANAGHNPPFLGSPTQGNRFLKTRPSLVLAGMDDTVYTNHSQQLHRGDRLFLYTDGATEAINPQTEQYGQERLEAFLAAHAKDAPKALLQGLKEDIAQFSGAAEQFDDITMLVLDFIRESPTRKAQFPADAAALGDITAFVEEHISCDPKTAMQLSLVTEEIFINIASYAYPDSQGTMTLELTQKDNVVTMVFTDAGKPFDPTSRPEAKTAQDDASIGGLGIFMVQKMMDACTYQRENNQNILTVTKKLSGHGSPDKIFS